MRKFSERVSFRRPAASRKATGTRFSRRKILRPAKWSCSASATICFAATPVSPYRELADMANISGGKSVSAVNRISAAELKGYGTIAGTRRAENPRLIDVSLIIEKPAVAVAQEKLRVNDLPAGTWLGWFGMHLLAPSHLRHPRRNDPRQHARPR